MSKFLFHAAVIGGALFAAVPAGAATLFTVAPDLSSRQNAGFAYNSISSSTTFAAQMFTLGSAATVDGFGFNSVLFGGPSATSAGYRVLRASDLGTPGALITSGSSALTNSVGAKGTLFATTDYRFGVAPLSLAAGSYFLAFRVVTTNDEDALSKGVATGGAFTSMDGGNSFSRGYAGFSSVAISVFGTEAPAIVPVAPVPEPASWAMMLLGFGAVGVAMRRRTKVETTVRFA